MTNNTRVAVPWKDIAENRDKYLDYTYLPVFVKMQDPSHMSATELRSLFNCWHKRQEKKEQYIFKFKTVDRDHVRELFGNSRKFEWEGMPWMVNSDSESEGVTGKGKGKGR
jgi:hypothetical protein